ncbi:GNAT family N-acetyltransferase [Flammeovirga pacifica]|uniref:N-acetyltransferase domain-containing protein n=1 Tax=Flammeovirga pacifica TaxID=915059 RepID=A0A1S1YTU3_FLAPC|nr:GNAT family N-acetyltransferase [Flammeovirga pacifica]OHX64447.1 hypothetical protein NH26_22950 [Flammeovirga pacifica]
MKKQIIQNVFEFWTLVGQQSNLFSDMKTFKMVWHKASDWPNRVFDIDVENLDQLPSLKNGSIPEGVTLDGELDIHLDKDRFEYAFNQINMSVKLATTKLSDEDDENIILVKNKKDAESFAKTASASFKYNVSSEVIFNMTLSENIRAFIYKENELILGCGILFFDSLNNAGFHMIGTIDEARGKGIGKKMTLKLLLEAKKENKNLAVLHASQLGLPIYKKYGFEEFGEIKTYRILN